MGHTQEEEKITSLNFVAKGKLPVNSILQYIAKNGQEVPTVSRRRTCCESAREERSNVGKQQSGQNGRSPSALSYEQLGNYLCSQEAMGLTQEHI